MNTTTDQFFGANCSYLDDGNNTSTDENCLPHELTEISESSFYCVIIYCLVFVVASSGNVWALWTLWKQHKIKRSRITLLFLHLSLADLIVTCVIIPTEVFWRMTIQWRGGNLLCKVSEFLRAFGLYLSSLVLVCVSLDRFQAIMYPLSVIGVEAHKKIKLMIGSAWLAAAVISTPQAIYFGVEAHPEFPSFKQCVTSSFLNNSSHMKIYSVFSVVIMYFVPLLVILCTYTAILVKLRRKSNNGSSYNFKIRFCANRQGDSSSGIEVDDPTISREDSNINNVSIISASVQLRCSRNAEITISKAKNRTLVMTIVIVFAFVVCWTPYAVMTLWYMLDWEGAANVDPWIQDALFLMVVANSCINPLIYGGFHYNRQK